MREDCLGKRVTMMKRMRKVYDDSNPHVLKKIGSVTATLPVMLVMQYVPNGSLKDCLRAKKVYT